MFVGVCIFPVPNYVVLVFVVFVCSVWVFWCFLEFVFFQCLTMLLSECMCACDCWHLCLTNKNYMPLDVNGQ